MTKITKKTAKDSKTSSDMNMPTVHDLCICTKDEYAIMQAKAKELEKHIDSLHSWQRNVLFALQKDCYNYLCALTEEQQQSVLEKFG